MCLFDSISTELTQQDENIISLFRNSTGVDCNLLYLDNKNTLKSLFASIENHDSRKCPSLTALENLSVEKIIKIFDSSGKPYIFFGQCMCVFIAVGIWSTSDNRKIYFAGPITIEDDLTKCSSICEYADFSKIPIMDSSHIKFAAQLLYDVVKFNMDSISLQGIIDVEQHAQFTLAKKAFQPLNSEFTFYEIFNASTISRNKKRIVKGLGYMKDHIESILNLIASGQLFLAKQVSEELILPIVYENDFNHARAYYIGIGSLLGQKIAESYDFVYTTEMFYFYSEFIDNISKAEDKTSILSTTESYFNNIFQELISAGKTGNDDTPAKNTVLYIQKNYKQDMNINMIANTLNFDASYLCRAFKLEMGVTIKTYITTYRIKKAAELILSSKKTILSIANDVGYHDVKLFVKHFKAQYGVAPTTYRQSFNRQ